MMIRRPTHATIVLLLGLLTAAPAGAVPLPGDLDRSGSVDVGDVVLALRMALRLTEPTPRDIAIGDVAPAGGTAGRVYGDGVLDAQDALRLLRRVAGLEPDPWPGATSDGSLPIQVRLNTQTPPNQPIDLREGFVVSGVVRDTAGNPVNGFVTLVDPFNQVSGTVRTGANGSYRLLAARGTYDAWVTSLPVSGRNTQVLSRQPVASITVNGDVTRDLVRPNLPPLHEVTVTLTQQDNRYRVVRALLFDANTQNRQGVPNNGDLVTVTNNRFTFVVPTGNYQVLLEAVAANLAPGVFAFVPGWSISVGASFNATRSLPPLSHLRGTVTGPDGRPVASGTAHAVPLPDAFLEPFADGVIDEGALDVWLGQGAYTLVIVSDAAQSPEGGTLGFRLTNVQAVGETVRNVVLPPFPERTQITGTVRDAQGRPAAGAEVYLDSISLHNVSPGYAFVDETVTAGNGSFTFSAPPGVYTLTIFPRSEIATIGPETLF